MIYIGADHRGFELKGKIEKWLAGRGYEFEDVGAFEHDSTDDYVDFGISVGLAVSDNPTYNRGILICGSGVGMCVATNKVRGIRCGLGFDPDQVNAARKEDNINVMSLAADSIDEEKAVKMVEMFLTTEFIMSERYRERVEKITRYESIIAEHNRN